MLHDLAEDLAAQPGRGDRKVQLSQSGELVSLLPLGLIDLPR